MHEKFPNTRFYRTIISSIIASSNIRVTEANENFRRFSFLVDAREESRVHECSHVCACLRGFLYLLAYNLFSLIANISLHIVKNQKFYSTLEAYGVVLPLT